MTVRTRAQLLTDYADNTTGAITEGGLRNLVDSITLTAESGPIVRPSSQALLTPESWTSVGVVDATLTSEDAGRRLYYETPTAQTPWQAKKKAKAGALAKITIAFWPFQSDGGNSSQGLYMRRASDGLAVTYGVGSVNGVKGMYCARLNAAGVWVSDIVNSAVPAFISLRGLLWLRLEDDGTNRVFSWSGDEGAHWRTLHSIARTDYAVFDEVGFAINSTGQTWKHAMSIINISET